MSATRIVTLSAELVDEQTEPYDDPKYAIVLRFGEAEVKRWSVDGSFFWVATQSGHPERVEEFVAERLGALFAAASDLESGEG